MLKKSTATTAKSAATAAIATCIACVFAAACAASFEHITAEMPDLSQKADGIYRGSYDLERSPLRATVDVTIQDRLIVNIDIAEHSASPIGKKGEGVIERIISSQTLDVDAVSGATLSSKTILKAVENALQ